MALYLNGNKISNSMVVNGHVDITGKPVNISDFSFSNKLNTTTPTVTKISDYEFALSYQDQSDYGYEQCIFKVTLAAGTYVAQIKATVDKNTGIASSYTWGIYSSSSSANITTNAVNAYSTYVPFDRSDTNEHTYYVPIVVRADGYAYICFATADDNGVNATVTVSSLKIYPAISVISEGGSYERLCYVTYVGNDAPEIPTISTIDEGTNYSSYLSYDSTTKKFTVLQDFIGIVTAWVYQYRSPGASYSYGTFYVNNIQQMWFRTYTLNLGDKGGTTGLFDFKQGDTFYSYTPSSDGYPQQMLKVYILSNISVSDIVLLDDENT